MPNEIPLGPGELEWREEKKRRDDALAKLDGSADSLPGTAKWREAHPAGEWLKNAAYNPLYSPRTAEYQANLARISQPQIQNPLVTTAATPVTTPLVAPQVAPSNAPQNPLQKTQETMQITLPEMFQPNYQMGPQQQAQQGIKMPDIKKPLQGFGGGSNWTDFLTVANNRYTR